MTRLVHSQQGIAELLLRTLTLAALICCGAWPDSNLAVAQAPSIHTGNYRAYREWVPFDPQPRPNPAPPAQFASDREASPPLGTAQRFDVGDTRGSQSAEARNMSPPHWGEDPEPLPPARSSGDSRVARDWVPREPQVAGGQPLPGQLDDNPFAQASLRREPAGFRPRSVYRSTLDPEFLESLNHEGWSPNLTTPGQSPFGSSPGQAAPQQSTPFRQPQTIQERGYRQPQPFSRGIPFDTGAQFDFENKHEQFPPMREILATGRYFAMGEVWLLRPHFNGNHGLATEIGNFLSTTPADHAYETAPRFRVGFESSYGPGVELGFLHFHHRSNPLSFTRNGAATGSTFVEVMGSPNVVSLSASAPGQRLVVGQSLELHSFQATVFKEIQFRRARINGILGIKTAAIDHEFRSQLFNPAGTLADYLNANTTFNGYGPTFSIEYYRPVGHTKLEMFGAAAGSTLLGNRTQWIDSGSFSALRTNSLELLTIAEINMGVQYQYHYAEKRCVYGRLAATHQSWLGGGTPTTPTGDFGFRGFAFAVGLNR